MTITFHIDDPNEVETEDDIENFDATTGLGSTDSDELLRQNLVWTAAIGFIGAVIAICVYF